MENIKTLLNLKYDSSKLNTLYERIEENHGKIEDINHAHEDMHGGFNHFKVCKLCGKIIVHDMHGYGSKCYNTIFKIMPLIAMHDDDFKKALNNYNLLKWSIYANTIKKLYIDINMGKNGMPKKFKNDFKKSFFNTILNSDKISKKQADIMIKDLFNYAFYNSIEFKADLNIKNDTIYNYNKEGHEILQQAWHDLLQKGHVIEFLRITYKKAWLDDTLNVKIDID